jgi:HupH hydrogenase expression protein, C-terminal conserved region
LQFIKADPKQYRQTLLKEAKDERTVLPMNFPLTNDDMQFLDETLGRGAITVTYRGRETTFWQEAAPAQAS